MRVFFRLFSHHRSPLPLSFLLLFLLQYLAFSHSHVLRRRHAPLTRLSSSSSSSSDDSSSLSPLLLSVREDDGRGGSRPVEYNPLTQRFEPLSLPSSSSLPSTTPSPSSSSLKRFLSKCFLPGGDITPDYYRYTLWRIGQRLVSATSAVFGTQALLMALGVSSSSSSSSSLLGIHAATMWVLKDALGKCSRIVWASKVITLFYSNISPFHVYFIYILYMIMLTCLEWEKVRHGRQEVAIPVIFAIFGGKCPRDLHLPPSLHVPRTRIYHTI